MRKWVLRCVGLLAVASSAFAEESWLARDGRAVAQIVIPEAATSVERTAAQELRQHLDAVTGAAFALVTEAAPKNGPRLLVGNTEASRKLVPGFLAAQAAYDSILLKTVGDEVILAGHPQRGALYAVYTFLEDEVGVRWWTSDETFIPRRTDLPLPKLDVRYTPKLRFRESYYLDAFNALFKTRLKGNLSSRTRYMLAPMEMIPELRRHHRSSISRDAARPIIRSTNSYHQGLLRPTPQWFSEIKGKRTHKKASSA